MSRDFAPWMLKYLRGKMRTKYGIQGRTCGRDAVNLKLRIIRSGLRLFQAETSGISESPEVCSYACLDANRIESGH